MERSLSISHGGKEYTGYLATIKSTMLGWEDHGILTAYLMCEWPSSGIGVGGYCLDETTGTPKYDRVGTAYGLDHIMHLIKTVGVNKWEDIPGKHVVVLFEGRGGTGGIAAGIAHATNDKIFICEEHAALWRDKTLDSAGAV
jgi:hypothetical protein